VRVNKGLSGLTDDVSTLFAAEWPFGHLQTTLNNATYIIVAYNSELPLLVG
jgi:hypothetical protein